LTGDADSRAFKKLHASKANLRANILVFPHHGGLSNGPTERFAMDLCDAVQPEVVVFSVGRAKRGFPRSEIVAAVRSRSSAHVACTQLNVECAVRLPRDPSAHLHPTASAAGRTGGMCCAGTLEVDFSASAPSYSPSLSSHRQFVVSSAPTRMCR